MKLNRKKYLLYFFKGKTISDALIDKVNGVNDDDKAIDEWLNSSDDAKFTLERFSKESHVKEIYKEFRNIDSEHSVTREKLIKRALEHRKKPKRLIIGRFVLYGASTAAIILLTFLIAPRFFTKGIPTNTISENHLVENHPTLILSNGETIDLLAKQTIAIEDKIKKTNGTNLASGMLDKTQKSNPYHTLVVPRAFTYSITLSDGSVVTLNANSELRYPVNFGSANREVFLKGEAYFDVKKSKIPFIVNSHDMKVKVYGTTFNVNANDKNVIKTVLVNGSVGVSFKGDSKEMMITPNQMIVVDVKNQKYSVEYVETARYTAWLDGYFRFDGNTLNDVLTEFNRWYGVDFKFTNDEDKNIKITASFKRDSKLEDILLTIGSTTKLKFIKKGGQYTIIK